MAIYQSVGMCMYGLSTDATYACRKEYTRADSKGITRLMPRAAEQASRRLPSSNVDLVETTDTVRSHYEP